MIEVCDLTKVYGDHTAVDHATFTVRPGLVTGFLGPNGAGKSTTMRAVLGLDRPTSGTVRVDGHAHRDLPAPLTAVGAALDAKALDRGRSARDHLRVLGATCGIGRARVDEVLGLVGLASVAHRRAGDFSLGMGQRLGLAAALLGDPGTIVLDEPANGLDPDGILWLRTLLRGLADEGRTVLLSSHLMSELQLVADHLVVIEAGRILADAPLHELLDAAAGERVEVVSPDAARLAGLLAAPGVVVTPAGPDRLTVTGTNAAAVGAVAARGACELHALADVTASLEDAYRALTHDAVQHPAASPTATEGAAR